MGNFFAELKRRHIYRVAAAYAVIAWLLLQIVNNVTPIMQAPAWVGQFCLLLLLLGFPLAIFFAWMRELPPSDAVAPMRATLTDRALIGVLFAVLVAVTYQQFSPTQATVATAKQPGVDEAQTAAASSRSAISIAVLPFANMSGDAGQEFFSDGMTEEITSALAKVPDLRVVGRTSAFQFKGRNQDLRTIGQSLAATHLIEGSVRKSGNRVRITVQLIKADDGTHIWAEDYDRQLTDIFATQEDIARAITTSLRMPLGLKPGENLVNNRTIDPDTYEKYLRARILVRSRQPMQATGAVSLLEEISARNPEYAPAWALLALAYDVTPQDPAWYSGAIADTRRLADDSLPKAEAAVQRAIQLDANLADGYMSLGRLQVRRGKLMLAEESYLEALALDPNNPDALQLYGNLLAEVGHLKDALTTMRKLRSVEPFVPILNLNAAVVVWLNGQDNEAIAIMEALPPAAAREIDLSQIHASAGRYREAADQLLKIPVGTFFPGIVEEAVRLLRSAPGTTVSPEALSRLGRMGFVYLYAGVPLRALEFHEAGVDAGYVIAITTAELWHSSYAQLRKTERFKSFVRKAGLVDYWRARGWPDLCRSVGSDDFVCD
jgi:adenylate cyclase